jgi:GT2 family glycosyltransferase
MALDRVQCVLVLYKTDLQQSETYLSLSAFLREDSSWSDRLSLLLYDNSPEPQSVLVPPGLFASVRYQHDPSNGGLAAAYNQALRLAEDTQCVWLWLFDQDTAVPSRLIPAAMAVIDGTQRTEISAIVPRLMQDGIVNSPLISERFRYRAVDKEFSGTYPGSLTALNSCACMRVSALRRIGGFPAQYWLDYLDHAVFHRLQEQGGKVTVLDVSISHRLSTNNLGEESSRSRYENVLAAEWRFVRETGWGGGSLVHRLRLLKRAARTFLTLREPAFALLVLKWSLR